jgi:hypothetical protein
MNDDNQSLRISTVIGTRTYGIDLIEMDEYMPMEDVREHLFPIIQRIVASRNEAYILFLQYFDYQFSKNYTWVFNVNREDLRRHCLDNVHTLIQRDRNVLRIFARDANGNRQQNEDGSYVMGVMDEYPELFHVLENYMYNHYREQLRPILFDYVVSNR